MGDFKTFMAFWAAGFLVALALSVVIILLAIAVGLIWSAVDRALDYYGPNWAVVTYMRCEAVSYGVRHRDNTSYLTVAKDHLSKPAAKRECARLSRGQA